MSVQSHKPNPMFKTYSSLEEALENANLLIDGIPLEYRLAAFTSVYGVLNTALRQLEEKQEATTPSAFVPPQRQHRDDPAFRHQFCIDKLSPEEALQVLRNELAGYAMAGFALHKLIPALGDEMLTLCMLTAQALRVTPETLTEEVEDLRKFRSAQLFGRKS